MTEEEAKQRAKEIVELWRDGLTVVLAQLAELEAENANLRLQLERATMRAGSWYQDAQ